jgi:hypothetical protein
VLSRIIDCRSLSALVILLALSSSLFAQTLGWFFKLHTGELHLWLTSPTGFSDLNGNPVNRSDVSFLISESLLTGLAGRNILRGPKQNRVDLSLTRSINLGFTPLE